MCVCVCVYPMACLYKHVYRDAVSTSFVPLCSLFPGWYGIKLPDTRQSVYLSLNAGDSFRTFSECSRWQQAQGAEQWANDLAFSHR